MSYTRIHGILCRFTHSKDFMILGRPGCADAWTQYSLFDTTATKEKFYLLFFFKTQNGPLYCRHECLHFICNVVGKIKSAYLPTEVMLRKLNLAELHTVFIRV